MEVAPFAGFHNMKSDSTVEGRGESRFRPLYYYSPESLCAARISYHGLPGRARARAGCPWYDFGCGSAALCSLQPASLGRRREPQKETKSQKFGARPAQNKKFLRPKLLYV